MQKKQTRNVKKIDSIYPAARVASQTYFLDERLAVKIEDPPEHNEDAPDLAISEEEFLLNYYKPFTALLHSTNITPLTETINDTDFLIVTVQEADIHIGIAANILTMIKHKNIDGLYSSFLGQADLPRIPAQTKIGKDGILIKLGESWKQDEMTKEPEYRERLYLMP